MKEFVKDGKIGKISSNSRYVVLDKGEGLPIFLGKISVVDNIPDEIPVRITYKAGEIIIRLRN